MGYKNTRKSYAIDPVKNSGPYEAIVRNVLDPGYAGSIQVEILKTYGFYQILYQRVKLNLL